MSNDRFCYLNKSSVMPIKSREDLFLKSIKGLFTEVFGTKNKAGENEQMKQLCKIALAFVLTVSMLSVGLKADAATAIGTPVEKKPYEYEFKETAALYNGFTGAKNVVITFDKNIRTITKEDVYVVQQVAGTDIEVPIIDTVSPVGKVLTITFKNLELIDHKKSDDFKLIIKKGKLYFDQLTNYELPFKFYDLLPGFESVFVNSNNAKLINEKIFMHNEPREVIIQVPPIYMTKIETIHRYKGVVDPSNNAPNLSNIDVIADSRAARLKVKLGTSAQHERDLNRSVTGVNGFSMGQAGITELSCVENDPKTETCKEYKQSDDFELTAYSEHGRKLETKNFKMRVNDREKDFKINDYVTADLKFFGKPVNLYEILASPDLLDKIVREVDVRALNDLAVVYSVGNSIEVKNLEQLQLALANEQFKTINVSGTINVNSLPDDTLIIDRNVTIKGGKIEGHLKLGNGTANKMIRLDDMTIDGDVTIDVGAEGTAIVSTSTVLGATTIVSGGEKSVHFNNFKSDGGIDISNNSPLRIVTSNSDPLIFRYNAKAPVQLEVISGKVDLSLSPGNELKESNAFTVLANKEEDVATTPDLTASNHFILNEKVLDEDDKTTATSVLVVAGNLQLPAAGMEFDVTMINSRISEDEPAKGKLTDWKIVNTPEGWTVDKDNLSGKFSITGAVQSSIGSIILEAKDDEGKSYTMELKVEII
ncbi:hypothetical protein DV702_00360 [Sporosarcina sp. PTS2304]|uniref:hypothetical protein n=1 Tax=Sporosarcina sp. PTS2304 TaxID=2283194 RepID=UPI000E0D9B9E|nr:hypothetical protein [Sporosarcina sp. PTS2304]AXH98289.1 hypothetical protein DV702_00360 [Sporosarcina sp. PTS2304]